MKNCIVALFVLAIVLGRPGDALALDLGLTPSHVFSLWTNINNSLGAISRVLAIDEAWNEEFAGVAPQQFEDKRPAEVLTLVGVYRAKLNELRVRSGLLPCNDIQSSDGDEVTPSDVYLNSGRVLNAQINWLIRHTSRDQLVSQFFARRGYSDKTPSDVYGLVDLANRKLDRILEKTAP